MKKNIFSKSLLAVVFVLAYFFNFSINVNDVRPNDLSPAYSVSVNYDYEIDNNIEEVKTDDLNVTLASAVVNFKIEENIAELNNDDLNATLASAVINFKIEENTADASSSFEKKLKKKHKKIKDRSGSKVANELGKQANDFIDDTVDAYLDPDSPEFKERKAREALNSLGYGESEVVFHDAKVRSAFKRLVKNDPYTTIVSNLYEEGISYYNNRGQLKTKRGPLVGFVVKRTAPGQVTYVRGR